MIANEEVARKLAAITGKPITEFFNGTINEAKIGGKDDIKNDLIHNVDELKVDNTTTAATSIQQNKEHTEKDSNNEVSGRIAEYLKLFTGSHLSPDDTKIMGGRQMTRKEYLKFIKGLDRDTIFKHPLMYKMYRAEGQTEAAFPAWTDKFPKVEYEDQE